MRKFILGVLTFLWLGFWAIFAQNILPDEAQIEVKSPIIQWEATNLTITMLKNWSKMSSYRGTVYITITDENWGPLNKNDYTVPQQWLYDFSDIDLWSATFEKWLEIKKIWTFYIEVEDFNDPDERTLWRQQIKVIRNDATPWDFHIEILSPTQNMTIPNQKVEIFAKVPELKNSNAIIYLDDEILDTTLTDSQWMINYVMRWVSEWRHSLKIEVLDMDWVTALWSSDKIYFTTKQSSAEWVNVTVDPEVGLIGETVKITAYTDEMIESVKIKLSDRQDNEAEVLPKVENWEFSKDVFLFNTWIINISLETSASNGDITQKFDNIKQFTVLDAPAITNIITWADSETQIATISRDVSNENESSSYLITYRLWEGQTNTLDERTDKKSFKFTDVPYDTTLNVIITPYRKEATKHWAASETIKFVITKWQPWDSENPDGASLTWLDNQPRCIVENISTRTKKIWDNYYLIWDKVENVSKYIVYSSTLPDGSDKMKVYETTDTSYQYPFDRTSEEDKFAYFWIVWICDDGQELELTGATKVQVWPAENFFLLLCMTFLIYFWIKLFRQTEE